MFEEGLAVFKKFRLNLQGLFSLINIQSIETLRGHRSLLANLTIKLFGVSLTRPDAADLIHRLCYRSKIVDNLNFLYFSSKDLYHLFFI